MKNRDTFQAVVIVLVFLIGPTSIPLIRPALGAATTAPTTQSADEDLIQFRRKTGIARVSLMRAAVKEADLPDEKRDKLLSVIDDSDQKLQDLLSEYANSPHEFPQEWDDKLQRVSKDFELQIEQILPNAVSRDPLEMEMRSIETEMGLIRKGTLINAMSKLNLTDEQKAKVKAIDDRAVGELKNPSTTKPSNSIPDSERRQTILLEAHEHVRDVLTDDQKSQWTTILVHPAESHN